MYIHELNNWTKFRWNNESISSLLDHVCREQGRLYGRLSVLGFNNQLYAMAENLARSIVYSSEIEGIQLNSDEVRSSIARRLGIEQANQISSSHYIEAVVAVMLDATEHYDLLLTKERLCAWQSAFFPLGFSEGKAIEVGKYRSHEEHIVSGSFGRERVHYIAPSPSRIDEEMNLFIKWFNSHNNISPIIRSAIAHFWFVSIHPFEDGNGRLARILGDIFLARSDKSPFRFYNMATAINQDKKHYYKILEQTQHGDGDITDWLMWYLRTLLVAIQDANSIVNTVLNKSFFWLHAASIPLSQRQIHTLNLFLDGYEAKITSKTWAALNHCSKDTAIRDIQDLQQKGLLHEDVPGAKRPSYSIYYKHKESDITTLFSDINIAQENGEYYLFATYQNSPIREHILQLDAIRYHNGDLPLNHLLNKYCSYLINLSQKL